VLAIFSGARGSCLNVPGVADDDAAGVYWPGNGAWAVGDGQSGGSSDGVGLVSVGNGGCGWAVSGVLGDDLSGVDHGAVLPGRDTSNGGSNSSDGRETHFDLFRWILKVFRGRDFLS
jgi:hypothetical protein